MDKVGIVKKAVYILNKLKQLNFVIDSCMLTADSDNKEYVDLEIQFQKNGGWRGMGFGFNDAWFNPDADPMGPEGQDKESGIEKATTVEAKLIIRIAYYLYDWYMDLKY